MVDMNGTRVSCPGSEEGSSDGEEGVPGPDGALVWPPPAEGEACPGQQEQLNKGRGQAASSSSSSSLVFPIPAILQPCQGVASLRTVPNQVA